MTSKTWLWISIGALALLTVCCCGVLLGGVIANQNATATQEAAGAATQVIAVEPTQAPAEPTQVPPTPTLVPTLAPPPNEVAPTQPPPPPATATSVPIPPPPPAPPAAPPAGSDLQALVDYANTMQPLLEQGGELVKRDGEILEASEGGNDAVLCDGRLAADNAAMANIVRQVRAIQPPANAAAIHDLVLRGGDAWNEGLGNIEQFCNTGNQLYKIPAVLKVWEAAALIQDAANRFWLLLLAEGVEDWVQR